MLLSGSADSTVKVWDVTTQNCMHTFNHHKDKVQAVAWNPAEGTIFASAGFDKQVAIIDARQPEAVVGFPLSADVECLVWNPLNPAAIAVCSSHLIVVLGY